MVSGELIDKVGRSQGWTAGPVLATCTLEDLVVNVRALLCQDRIRSDTNAGDSGAPVFRFIGNGSPSQVRALSLNWGRIPGNDIYLASTLFDVSFELGGVNVLP
jgi:hypothetical protein